MPRPTRAPAPSPSMLRARGPRALAIAAVCAALVAGGLAASPAAAQTPPAAAQAAVGSSLTANAAEFAAGQRIVLDYATDAPHDKNWIGIYRVGTRPGSLASLMWEYAPGASGQVRFRLDLAAGEYRAYLFAKDRYGVLGEPVDFTVTVDPAAAQPGDPSTPVEIDPVATAVATDGVLLREGFDDGALPAGWRAGVDEPGESGAADFRGWSATTRTGWSASTDAMRDRFARVHRGFLVADAAQFGAELDATLTSAPVEVAGLSAVRLTFDSHYRGAAGQSGVVTASFDGGAPVELLRLDETSAAADTVAELNAMQDLVVDVPAGAQRVEFSWRFTGDANGYYWGIDSVAVHQVLREASGGATGAWVVSDIQGHPHDLEHGIGFLHEHHGDASGLLMVGDIVPTGTAGEWSAVAEAMARTEARRPAVTVAAMGNHERYALGGFAANRNRFLDFADRDRVWYEEVLQGAGGELPVIVLGQEFWGPSEVSMSEAQVRFLEERLAHWSELGKQVLVISHYPLEQTVSGSWMRQLASSYQHNDRLTSILGNYPNAIMLTGHTHFSAEHGDWAVQRRTDDGHADGFWAVNTVSMQNGWRASGESTGTAVEVPTGDVNSGLAVEAYADRTVITAYDFASGAKVREIVIPNPLVEFAAR